MLQFADGTGVCSNKDKYDSQSDSHCEMGVDGSEQVGTGRELIMVEYDVMITVTIGSISVMVEVLVPLVVSANVL